MGVLTELVPADEAEHVRRRRDRRRVLLAQRRAVAALHRARTADHPGVEAGRERRDPEAPAGVHEIRHLPQALSEALVARGVDRRPVVGVAGDEVRDPRVALGVLLGGEDVDVRPHRRDGGLQVRPGEPPRAGPDEQGPAAEPEDGVRGERVPEVPEVARHPLCGQRVPVEVQALVDHREAEVLGPGDVDEAAQAAVVHLRALPADDEAGDAGVLRGLHLPAQHLDVVAGVAALQRVVGLRAVPGRRVEPLVEVGEHRRGPARGLAGRRLGGRRRRDPGADHQDDPHECDDQEPSHDASAPVLAADAGTAPCSAIPCSAGAGVPDPGAPAWPAR